MLADNAKSFAEAVCLLLRDAQCRRGYEQAAAKVAAQYDWSNIERLFSKILTHVSSAQPARASSRETGAPAQS
jgi:hypothetical protein